MDRKIESPFIYLIWFMYFLAACGILLMLVILYDATVGRMLDRAKNRPLRKVINLPDEKTIEERGKVYFYIVTLVKLTIPVAYLFLLTRSRRRLVILMASILAILAMKCQGFW